MTSQLGDIRDKERANKLIAAGVPQKLADDCVDSEQDASSWNTFAYSSLVRLINHLIGEEDD